MSKQGQSNPTTGGGGQNRGNTGQNNRQQGPRHSQSTGQTHGSAPPRVNAAGQQNNNRTSNGNGKGANAKPLGANLPATPTPQTKDGINPAVLTELKGATSQPVRLHLQGGETQTGLLYSYDVGMEIVALEIPKAFLKALTESNKSDPSAYPSTAASYPTALSSSVKLAAQGGDSTSAKTNFEIIPLRRVQRVERLQAANAASANGNISQTAMQALHSSKLTPVKKDINVAAAEARERAATAEASKRAAKIGVGVSKLGQDVFDGLSKTLPCRWADRHIIVMDEFAISPDKYDTATIPNVPLTTLQAIAEGREVEGAPDEARGQATRWQRVTKVLEGERKKILANANATVTAK
ncbi:uncharacterized protein FA14DRAFT_25942 [Meira miltonrushii]|uniref:AD domain-containing protein n=1 Tax=Meira miltonrushii TaxID=1280837 RepID=A0A316VLA5_9BASI|nr:uncharacterized protein FA14DRAFT_25942 [Meira miltonrushii]PWN38336.1 hypothetical protein FA14DRAFT_25942 [Meira miltonrushii]